MILQIKVNPRSRTSELVQSPDGTWRANLKSPPVDGKANAELIDLVAVHIRCRKAAISIRSGASARVKLVEIAESGS